MGKIKERYNPFKELTFTYDRCFLCGALLTKENTTAEHIYPKWLQNMFDLWDKKLILLNGTSIRYKDLKIPCCISCNKKMSSMIEKPIERAINGGFDKFIKIDRNLVFLWLNKLAYGMLFKELSLSISQSDPQKGKIFTVELLEEYDMQYMFLQSILTNATFVGSPYSLLLFRIDPCEVESYWAHDNPIYRTFFIRMNDIGIISNLMDNGFNENFFLQIPEFEQLKHKTLHPIQFTEICAKFLYKSSLFYRNPPYLMVMNDEQKPDIILSHGMSGDGYNEWIQENYVKILAYFWEPYGFSLDDIKRDNRVFTLLYQEDGSFIDLVSQMKLQP